jgi:hypothetical protein
MKSIYEEQAEQIGKLVAEKNAAYGSAFAQAHQILSVLYPKGITPEQYTDALAVIRVIDKLFRIATAKDAFGESPWRDIGGYAILGVVNDAEKRNTSKQVSNKHKTSLDKSTKKVTSRKKN